VRLDCDPNFSLAKATTAFSGVEELTIEVFQAQFGSSDYKVLRLFEEVRGVKRTRVYGSVTAFPEYIAWLEAAIVTPEEGVVEVFDKEKAVISQLRAYDIWTVSRNKE
jgi:CTP-dependent riboflavin kinase